MATGFSSKYYSHTTDTEAVCLHLKWKIKNISKLLCSIYYKYPYLRPTPQCDLAVCCFFNDGLGIHIKNNLNSNKCIYFNATTIIFDVNKKKIYQETLKQQILKTDYINIVPGCKNRNNFTETIVIEIKLNLLNADGTERDTADQERQNEVELLEDMKNYILADRPAEVVLKTKDAEILANKALLCARSSVFRKMFDHPTSEQEESVVRVDDVNGGTLNTLVGFLCSGTAELPKSDLPSLQELYYAADKYAVLSLRKMCAQAMLSLLNLENAFGVLVLADRHSDEFLKSKCLVFMSTRIEPLMKTEEWVNLKVSTPGLVVEVYESLFKSAVSKP